MYWQLMVVSLAFCWLAHRIYALATVPIDQLVKTLAVDIPRAATISVDNITDNAVYMHWDKPPKDSEHRIVSFLVFLNGKRVATLSGRDVHTHIAGLIPSTKYQIDLVTVNHKNYQAKSRPVFIKTKSTELQLKSHSNASENPLENPETLFKMLTENSDLSVEKLPAVTLTTPSAEAGDLHAAGTPNGRRGGRSRSNTVSSTANIDLASTTVQSINMMPDPKSMVDIEELRYYLESRQEELHTVLNQQNQILQEFKEQELLLSDQRKQLRERKKLEDNDRSLVKSQINNLDESRRNAELKRSKQEANVVKKQKLIEKMTRELAEWNITMDEFEQDKLRIEASEDTVHEELDTDIEKKKAYVKELQHSVSVIEDEIKQLLVQKKQREQNRPQLLKIFKTIGRHTDSTGLIDQEGVQNLSFLSTVDPSLWEKVNKEIVTDSQLEAQWRAEQQRAVSNCEKANATKDFLLSECEKMKNGQTGSLDLTAGIPSMPPLNGAGSSQAISSLNVEDVRYPQISSASNSNSNNSFSNGYFSGSVSPPTASAVLHAQSLSSNPLQSSLWSNNGLSLSYNPASRLSLTTNTKSTDLLTHEELDSPSIDHFLPTDLISEQFNDVTFPMSPDKNNSTPSDGIGSGQSSTPKNTNISLVAGSAATSFTQNMHFPGEFNNLSSRSIFHNDFGMVPNPMRLSLDNPSSPPLSFQNEFLSAHNSPVTNSNDLASIFSGGNVDVLPTFSQTSGEAKAPTAHKSAFSPRRLSSVFGFGNKTKNTTSNSIDAATSSTLNGIPIAPSSAGSRSKFFHKSQNSDLSPLPSVPEPPIFKFDQSPQNPGTVNNSAFNILDVWNSPLGTEHTEIKQSFNGHGPEESSKTWLNTTSEPNTSGDSKFVGIPSSSNSLSSQAVSDAMALADIGPVVQLTSTNKSTKSIKSKSSIDGSSSSVGALSSPSGLFRRKSNLLNFGHKKNPQSAEKSPMKQHVSLTRMESPTRIDSHEDGEVEDFAPPAPASKKLFSRRMSFNTNIRKQSNSSHETDGAHGQDQTSVQSTSTTNSRSIVRKLSLFGNKMNTAKDTNVIDEHDDEDDRS